MFQPFELFKPIFIKRLIKLNKTYIVSQTYKAGFDHFDEGEKVSLLLTDYEDIGLANIHKTAVKSDKYAAVLNLKNPKHLEKLESMLEPNVQYIIFWSVVKDMERIKKRIDTKYKDNIRRYIKKNTNWRAGGEEEIRPQLSVIFGELFIFLKRGAQELRVKFEEIEKS
jgi:tRNA A58 N-methylase Trm61